MLFDVMQVVFVIRYPIHGFIHSYTFTLYTYKLQGKHLDLAKFVTQGFLLFPSPQHDTCERVQMRQLLCSLECMKRE